MTAGDALTVIDSSGNAFEARLALDGKRTHATLERALDAAPESSLEITLAQGVPKGAKMDFVVEKATELGVSRLIPLVTERTLGSQTRGGKIERWRRLARSAAQQCGRRDVPQIDEITGWADFCAAATSFERTFVPWELAERQPLRDRLPQLLAGVRRVAIAIGPEGGLSHAEVDQAVAAGARTISLGRRILRTETAGLVACSLFLYTSGNL
jgi:16S rRNA (uracil1498-N3)-methyltransferase